MTLVTMDGKVLSTSWAAQRPLPLPQGPALAASIAEQVLELAHDSWKRERRGYHGEWVGGEGVALRVLGIKSKHGYLQGEYHGHGGLGPFGKHLSRKEAAGVAQMLAAFHAEQGARTSGGEQAATLPPGSFRRGVPGERIYDLPAAQGATAAQVSAAAEAAGFHGPLTARIHLGGDQQHWGELASALNSIPAPLQQKMAGTIGEIRLEHQIPVPSEISGIGNIVGLYTPGEHGWASGEGRGKGNGLLQLATEAGSAGTARHEAMHALDEASGYPSDKFRWRRLAFKIRHAAGRRSAPEFQSNGTGNDSRRAAEELWAELASQILGGASQLELDPVRGGKVFHAGSDRAALPDALAAEVRAYFAEMGLKAP